MPNGGSVGTPYMMGPKGPHFDYMQSRAQFLATLNRLFSTAAGKCISELVQPSSAF